MTLKPQQHLEEQGVRVPIPHEELDIINREWKRARREIRRKLAFSAIEARNIFVKAA